MGYDDDYLDLDDVCATLQSIRNSGCSEVSDVDSCVTSVCGDESSEPCDCSSATSSSSSGPCDCSSATSNSCDSGDSSSRCDCSSGSSETPCSCSSLTSCSSGASLESCPSECSSERSSCDSSSLSSSSSSSCDSSSSRDSSSFCDPTKGCCPRFCDNSESCSEPCREDDNCDIPDIKVAKGKDSHIKVEHHSYDWDHGKGNHGHHEEKTVWSDDAWGFVPVAGHEVKYNKEPLVRYDEPVVDVTPNGSNGYSGNNSGYNLRAIHMNKSGTVPRGVDIVFIEAPYHTVITLPPAKGWVDDKGIAHIRKLTIKSTQLGSTHTIKAHGNEVFNDSRRTYDLGAKKYVDLYEGPSAWRTIQ